MNLVSHVYADGDIMQAWLDHYVRLGINRFDLVLHGPEADNATLLGLRDRYPIVIHEMYGGGLINAGKTPGPGRVLAGLRDQWVLLVDSDEFVELPAPSLGETIRLLERTGTDALAAPMLQRIRTGGCPCVPSPAPATSWCAAVSCGARARRRWWRSAFAGRRARCRPASRMCSGGCTGRCGGGASRRRSRTCGRRRWCR